MTKRILTLFLALALILSACQPITTPLPTSTTPAGTAPQNTAAPASTQVPQATLAVGESPVLISEVLAGVPGNNNLEFIELYNRSPQIVDLNGSALWYRMPTSSEDQFVYRWNRTALIPPYGHYLLAHLGEALEIAPDAEFEQALNTSAGGLQLRQTDGTVLDALGWGKAPESYFEGEVAPALQNGLTLERLSGGAAGSFQDSGNNLADFRQNDAPDPQNTGSRLTPDTPGLTIQLEAPASAEPGGSFTYRLSVSNRAAETLTGVEVLLPLAAELQTTALPEDVKLGEKNLLRWQPGDLQPGEQVEVEFTVQTPWTYFTALAANYYAQAQNTPLLAFGAPIRTRIEGGVIPIATARTLIGSEMTIEGIASMYTGGYFAGSGNNKFYLQDETGGIQVQVFGGLGAVNVGIGAHVRVRGKVELYRGAAEIVPLVVPEDVQVLANASESPQSQPAASAVEIEAALTEAEALPGRLVQVAGDITRIEEYNFSFEIDLYDQRGHTLTLYVDKQTNINVEEFIPGMQLSAIGILDVSDTTTRLYPRLQTDLQEIVPPVLRSKVRAPNSILPGETFTVTFSAENGTAENLNNLLITSTLPANSQVVTLLDGGKLENGVLHWQIDQLAPGAVAQVSVQLQANVTPAAAQPAAPIAFAAYGAASDEMQSTGTPFYTFIGTGVPVWAIQGSGSRSPYTGQRLSTVGVVTAVFPELGGFWIQEPATDDDPSTSAGVFVRIGAPGETELPISLAAGDLVQVSGQVREPAQQTTLDVLPTEVKILGQQPLPAALELNPPANLSQALVYFESLEGMLVQVSSPATAVSATSRYGEVVVVRSDSGIERFFQGQDNGRMIMVDDGSNQTYTDGSQQPYRIATGDTVAGLFGPLSYTYGRYKIQPLAPLQVSPGAYSQSRAQGQPPALQTAAAGQFTLMTWNVENLFDTRDPHPADPPKPGLAQYRLEIDKVAATIAAAGAPTIVALQEVENIGVLQELARHDLLSDHNYEAVLIEGNDSRGIDVGYLVRGDQAKVLDVQQRPAPEGLTSRPPLIVKIEVRSGGETTNVYVINNHFTSMSGGVDATEIRRNAQAAWNVGLLEEILTQDPQAQVAVVGDLNSYFDSLPIQTLRQGGLQHAFDTLLPEARYTYIYQGESQVLDHILLSPQLYQQVIVVQVFHINADYPLSLPEDASIFHKSDHDPVVVIFDIP